MDHATIGRRRTLAALAAGAGAIHLALVPAHVDEWALEGWVFGLVGFAQIAVAVVLHARDSRTVELFAAGGSAVLVGIWALSRISGLPFGPHAWHAEAVGFVDLAAVGLEAAFVVIALVPARRIATGSVVFAIVIPLVVVALSMAAIASPSARDHAHVSHEGHDAHGDDTTATHAAGAHHGSEVAAGDGGVADHSDHGASGDGAAALAGGHTHPDDFKPYLPMDAATFKLLGEQLVVVRELTMRYPTVADAEAAGFRRRGSFVPGQGAHYFPPGGLPRGATAIERPISWLYAGTEPTSPVVGVMYTFVDFAGPNDRFHYHSDVCLGPTEADGTSRTLSEAEGISAAECTALGGVQFIPRAGPLMHVWAVPGWESPIGVFSHDNPLVVCTDGQQPAEVTQGKGGCKGLG